MDNSIDDAFTRGAALLASLSPAGSAPPWETFADVAPTLGRSVGTAFGTIIDRPGLDLRTRELVTVAVLATLGGCEPQVTFHTGAALRAGASAQEIVETLTHVSVYAGIPRALNAVAAARIAFVDAGVSATSTAPRTVVVEFLAAAARDDRTVSSGPHEPALSGTWKGPDEIAAFARVLAQLLQQPDAWTESPLAAGDTVFVPVRHGRGAAVLEFQVRDGCIEEVAAHAHLDGGDDPSAP